MYHLGKEHLIYAMSPDHPPALTVPAGSTIQLETRDCYSDQIVSTDSDFSQVDMSRVNPATGPVYVEGAEPGDILVVHIKTIEINNQGVMVTGPGRGVMGHELENINIRIVNIEDGYAALTDKLKVPLQKMIGVIGTAPASGSVSCGSPGEHGGNMDCKQIREGTTLLLPVNVPGALFALGDLHAAMADGEVAICGVEIAGQVTVKLDVVKAKDTEKPWPLPMLITDEHLITIASAKDLDSAANRATVNMVHFLADELGLGMHEATCLLSAAGDLRICQVVNPLKTARMELQIRYATEAGFDPQACSGQSRS
ncbi:acetamidase/formamidase family protein [Brevibacillus dissolubilis]|uniref:acetamidase/formamidase family protein n=1 Tax=Brevibacillus dissolubilis TaxID=1844116 RepID=UPI0011165605|nr:acetamidase/formamidase family protein [Brevibacillus dissolubilis]